MKKKFRLCRCDLASYREKVKLSTVSQVGTQIVPKLQERRRALTGRSQLRKQRLSIRSDELLTS